MDHQADKSMMAMFSLLGSLKQLGHPPIPVILQLHESMLKGEVWGFNENKDLKRYTSFTYLCLLLIWLCMESLENCRYIYGE